MDIFVGGICLESSREALQQLQETVQFLPNLPRSHGEPWLVTEVFYLLPDLAQFRPHPLEVLELFKGHEDSVVTATDQSYKSKENRETKEARDDSNQISGLFQG